MNYSRSAFEIWKSNNTIANQTMQDSNFNRSSFSFLNLLSRLIVQILFGSWKKKSRTNFNGRRSSHWRFSWWSPDCRPWEKNSQWNSRVSLRLAVFRKSPKRNYSNRLSHRPDFSLLYSLVLLFLGSDYNCFGSVWPVRWVCGNFLFLPSKTCNLQNG